MIKGILGHTYIDLSSIVNLTDFDNLHPEICRSFALSKHIASVGLIDVPDGYMNTDLYVNQFKLLHKAYQEFSNLPDSHPIKIGGNCFTSDNDIAVYLKYALGGYNLYTFYVVYDFKDGWRNDPSIRGEGDVIDYFPGVVSWLNKLVSDNVFSHIGRATFFVQEAGGVSFEHHDPSLDPENPDITSEFIHFRTTLDRPFYVRDSETLEKTYINARAAYWNDQDRHGGDTVLTPTYSFRVDGVFTEEFRLKIKNVAERI